MGSDFLNRAWPRWFTETWFGSISEGSVGGGGESECVKGTDGRTGRELYTEQSVHFPEEVLRTEWWQCL